MGVTEPVVPMWLPEGYELVEIESMSIPTQDCLLAQLSDGTENAVVQINVLYSDKANILFKDGDNVEIIECYGVIHNIMNNYGQWVITWTKENIECAVYVDCQEDDLRVIIESIYKRR